MKKLFFILLLISFSRGSYTQDYWIHKPSPAVNWLTRIQFVDTLYGWASGDLGTIINTTNGGLNWNSQNSGIVGYAIDDMFFLNRRLGWALANNYYTYRAQILTTTNGGVNWIINEFFDTTQVLHAVYFMDSLTGFLGAFTGPIYKTTNGGVNWVNTTLDTNYCSLLRLFPKYNINFMNSQTGFACGGLIDMAGIIWKTTDSGLNWVNYCVAPEPFKRIQPLSNGRILAVGGDYDFGANSSTSTNSGNNWAYNFLNIWGEGRAMAFRTPAELWVPLAHAQTWGVNLDSGFTTETWFTVPCPDSTSVYDALFITPTFGWACGTSGALLKYNSDIIGIQHNGNNVPREYLLFQNYPNPFNPVTKIKFSLPFKAGVHSVKLKIYDVLGKEVTTLVNEQLRAGTYDVDWDASEYSSGVYYYKLTAGDFTQTKKMVILK